MHVSPSISEASTSLCGSCSPEECTRADSFDLLFVGIQQLTALQKGLLGCIVPINECKIQIPHIVRYQDVVVVIDLRPTQWG